MLPQATALIFTLIIGPGGQWVILSAQGNILRSLIEVFSCDFVNFVIVNIHCKCD